MTPEDKKASINTAKIIRTARKIRGWTQIDTAKIIGISQSALSKMESAALIPSVHQWFEFCNTAGIPADSHMHGYLDRMEIIRFQEKITLRDFKIKDSYRVDAGSSARSLAPLIQSLYSSVGEEKAKKIIKEMGVDPDYFVDLGNPINFSFFVDLFNVIKKKTGTKKIDLTSVSTPATFQKSHGALLSSYQLSLNAESLMKMSFTKSEFYEVNFNYKIEDSNNKKLVFSVSPKEHILENKSLQFSEAREFISDYRAGYFKNLVQNMNANQTTVKSVQCVSDQRDRSIYEFSFL